MTKDKLVDKLFEDDLDNIITGNQQRDNSYLFDLLYSGFKGYANHTKKELEQELKERKLCM